MKTLDIFIRSGRNIRKAKLRTILTTVAIAIGGFAVFVSIAAGEGARQYIDRIITSNLDPQSIMVSKDKRVVSMTSDTSSFTELQEYNADIISDSGMDIKAISQDEINQIKKIKGVKTAKPIYSVTPKFIEFSLKTDKKYKARIGTFDPYVKKRLVAGKLPALGKDIAKDQVVVPASYLDTLGIKNSQTAIGSKITLTVSQIPQNITQQDITAFIANGGLNNIEQALSQGQETKKTLTIIAVAGKDPTSIVSGSVLTIGAELAEELSEFSTKGTDNYQKYAGAMVIAKADTKPEDLKASLEKAHFYAMTAKDMQGLIFSFVNLLQTIVLGFGVLALIVSVFGVINTQYISVLERTQQIGLMKALGASRWDIAKLFLFEAAWIGLFGGILGTLLASGLGALVNPTITENLGLGEGNYLLIFQATEAVKVILLLSLVAILAGWLPSRKAAKLDPIEALRTE